MTTTTIGAPSIRSPTINDFKACIAEGFSDFVSSPVAGAFFSAVFVATGLIMSWVTLATGQTFWLVLVVLGFPIVGTLSAIGFYEISRRRGTQTDVAIGDVLASVWEHRKGQLPWLAVIIVVVFLFWFFLGHMIFALFLGLSPMTNVSTSLDVFLTSQGLAMLAFGTVVGAVLSTVVFSFSVLGVPMIFERDVDFVTAMITSMAAVKKSPVLYLAWGAFVAVVSIVAMLPIFLGLFVAIPILGHASWHLYRRVTASPDATNGS